MCLPIDSRVNVVHRISSRHMMRKLAPSLPFFRTP